MMKYCCDEFEDAKIWGLLKWAEDGRDNYWFIGEYNETHQSPKYDEAFVSIDYCPFCGKKLEKQK